MESGICMITFGREMGVSGVHFFLVFRKMINKKKKIGINSN